MSKTKQHHRVRNADCDQMITYARVQGVNIILWSESAEDLKDAERLLDIKRRADVCTMQQFDGHVTVLETLKGSQDA